MLKIELTGQRSHTATGSGQTGNEAVAGAALKAHRIFICYFMYYGVLQMFLNKLR